MKSYSKQIHRLLDVPREFDPAWQRDWHEDAVEVFVDPADDMVERLACFGANVLREFDYDGAETTLAGVYHNYRALHRVRDQRKVLMVGRDVVNLTNTEDIIHRRETKPLTTFITRLGNVADTNAQKKRPIRIARRSVGPARDAAEAVDDVFLEPVTHPQLVERARAALYTDQLVKLDGYLPESDEASFHLARREFRSVVHLGVASQLLEPSNVKLAYVQQGVELNRIYGERHDMLVAMRPRDDEVLESDRS